MATLHDLLDRCDKALARIEAALAARDAAAPAGAPDPRDEKLRAEVAAVIAQLDGLIGAEERGGRG